MDSGDGLVEPLVEGLRWRSPLMPVSHGLDHGEVVLDRLSLPAWWGAPEMRARGSNGIARCGKVVGAQRAAGRAAPYASLPERCLGTAFIGEALAQGLVVLTPGSGPAGAQVFWAL